MQNLGHSTKLFQIIGETAQDIAFQDYPAPLPGQEGGKLSQICGFKGLRRLDFKVSNPGSIRNGSDSIWRRFQPFRAL